MWAADGIRRLGRAHGANEVRSRSDVTKMNNALTIYIEFGAIGATYSDV